MLASSSDSSDSYNGDDAQRFLREWRTAQNRYSEATRENGQLEICLGVSQAALHAAEEEANAVRAWLAESDAMVVGKMNSMNAYTLTSIVFHVDIPSIFRDHQPWQCSWSLSNWR